MNRKKQAYTASEGWVCDGYPRCWSRARSAQVDDLTDGTLKKRSPLKDLRRSPKIRACSGTGATVAAMNKWWAYVEASNDGRSFCGVGGDCFRDSVCLEITGGGALFEERGGGSLSGRLVDTVCVSFIRAPGSLSRDI